MPKLQRSIQMKPVTPYGIHGVIAVTHPEFPFFHSHTSSKRTLSTSTQVLPSLSLISTEFQCLGNPTNPFIQLLSLRTNTSDHMTISPVLVSDQARH